MRRFSSYGPINKDLHYYAPRKELIEKGYSQLTAANPTDGGHYFTIWAPRQTGKTWIVQEIIEQLKQTTPLSCGIITMERAKQLNDAKAVLEEFVISLREVFKIDFPDITEFRQIPTLFTGQYFKTSVVLFIDEFDSLEEEFINSFVSIFRDIYTRRSNEKDKPNESKTYLLQGLGLIGVRSVLGIENQKGSPFNVQRSLHIPNLTFEEVREMFQWYEKESGQAIDPTVIQRLYYETNGQPGLTCWFGELMTEGFDNYVNDRTKPITTKEFDIVYAAATYTLPNNNILNLISKAKEESNKQLILKMFQTDVKIEFKFDDSVMNSLYMNGVIEPETVDRTKYFLKFAGPFVQKRLFNYFSGVYFNDMGEIVPPFTSLSDVVTDTELHIPNLMKLYQKYIKKNREWLFKSVPRRSDMRIYEAMFHFNLYSYLNEFLKSVNGRVIPEFPTGNGKIDLILFYESNRYGMELKSFSNERSYKDAILQASKYGKRLNLESIFLVVFVETIDDNSRKKYEVSYSGDENGVQVIPIFIETGN